MAQPIRLTQPPRDPKQELLARLDAAPTDHAAALLDGYELLQSLHESGLFILLRGALGAKEKIIETAAGAANTQEAIRATRNLILLGKMLAAVDPVVLSGLASAVQDSLAQPLSIPHDPPTLCSLLSNFFSSDSRRALGFLNRLLRNLGYRLRLQSESNPPDKS